MRKKRLAKHKKKDSHTNGSPVCRFFEFIKKTDWGAGLWVFLDEKLVFFCKSPFITLFTINTNSQCNAEN